MSVRHLLSKRMSTSYNFQVKPPPPSNSSMIIHAINAFSLRRTIDEYDSHDSVLRLTSREDLGHSGKHAVSYDPGIPGAKVVRIIPRIIV